MNRILDEPAYRKVARRQTAGLALNRLNEQCLGWRLESLRPFYLGQPPVEPPKRKVTGLPGQLKHQAIGKT